MEVDVREREIKKLKFLQILNEYP